MTTKSDTGQADEVSEIDLYFGALTAEDTIRGQNLAMINANDLWNAAKLLIEKDFDSIACALCVLAIEETEKVDMLREIFLTGDAKRRSVLWRNYRNHKPKQVNYWGRKLVGDLIKSNGGFELQEFDKLRQSATSLSKVQTLTNRCGSTRIV